MNGHIPSLICWKSINEFCRLREYKIIKRACFAVIVFCVCTAVLHGFLQYKYIPQASDGVVLFIGFNTEKRLDKAEQLLRGNVSSYLIVPCYKKVISSAALRNKKSLTFNQLIKLDDSFTLSSGDGRDFFWGMENTHKESLIAREIIKDMGLDSVTMVSEPYHMRRIKIISEHVFAGVDVQLSYAPSDFSDTLSVLKKFWSRLKWVYTEAVKILWFYCYSHFV